MHRRDVIRRLTLTAFAMAMGKYDALAVQDGGSLTCDLNQYRTLVFKYKHETVVVTVAEVFQALKDGVQ